MYRGNINVFTHTGTSVQHERTAPLYASPCVPVSQTNLYRRKHTHTHVKIAFRIHMKCVKVVWCKAFLNSVV